MSKELNIYSFGDECYVYYGDYAKEIERLKEKVKEWQDIATRINEDNNKLNYIIKEVREYIKDHTTHYISYLGREHKVVPKIELQREAYDKLLEILKGEE